MRRAVHKFRIGWGDVSLTLPRDAKFLHFDRQSTDLVAWFEVEKGVMSEERLFKVFATGEHIDDGFQHVGSLVTDHLVWHLYEKKGRKNESRM